MDIAELAGVDYLLELSHARVVLEEVPDHQAPAAGAIGVEHALGLECSEGERLLHEAGLACLQDSGGKLRVRGHRSGHRDCVQGGVGQQVVQLGREASTRKQGLESSTRRLAAITAPRELARRQSVEVSGKIRAPISEPDYADFGGLRVHEPLTVHRARRRRRHALAPSPLRADYLEPPSGSSRSGVPASLSRRPGCSWSLGDAG